MPIGPGKKLLHYELVEKIGEGGMGVVWRATDTTLDREVAIKVLPDLFAQDSERLVRFEREAKLLASLNHANIAGIYGLHADGDVRFLTMELISGEDLAERLKRGPLPRDEALAVALQVARALEAAHENGVIHRDLKPANIKLATDGTVKVLDFGLAKAFAPDGSGQAAHPSMSPTLTSAGTMAGVILGTAGYMSPEQAKGTEVDRRADIWSFGVVLTEMLTGRRMFDAATVSETLAAVIMKEIKWGDLPRNTPRAVRRLLRRCLEREPQARLRDIGEARIAIEEAQSAPDDVGEPAAAAQPLWQRVVPWAVAVVALAALAFVWLFPRGEVARDPVMRFPLPIQDASMAGFPMPSFAISPDGSRITYLDIDENDRIVLFVREIDRLEGEQLRGTVGAESPFFSPDGKWIAFGQEGKLKKVSVAGGPPVTLCDANNLRGGTWGEDGTIVFAPNRATGLWTVSDAGGEPAPLTEMPVTNPASIGGPSHRWPHLLPDGRHVLFTSTPNNSQYQEATVSVASLADGATRVLIDAATHGSYSESGHLLFVREGTLFAAAFDADSATLTGPPVPVVDQVYGDPTYGNHQYSLSRTGTLVYLSGGALQERGLVWFGRDGSVTKASERIGVNLGGSLSPDGTQAAIAHMSGGNADVWVLGFERETVMRLTFDEAVDVAPIWSRDGKWITFTSDRGGGVHNLYRKRADGTGEVERLTESDSAHTPSSWSPDGSVLAFFEENEGTNLDLMLYRDGADPKVEVFLKTPFFELNPAFSPDGRWISYISNETGQLAVYVRPFGRDGARVPVTSTIILAAGWNPKGGEMILGGPSGMWSVSYTEENGEFRPSSPVKVTDVPPEIDIFSITPDGERFLAAAPVDDGEGEVVPAHPTVVVNWFTELQ